MFGRKPGWRFTARAPFNSTELISFQCISSSNQNNSNQIQFNFNSIQFNWSKLQFRHQFESIETRFQLNSVSFEFQINSISIIHFNSLRFNFKFNLKLFKSSSIRFNLNSIRFRFISIHLNETRSFETWKGCPPRQAESYSFSKRFVMKTNKFSPAAKSRFFNIFRLPNRTSLFKYINDRFWLFFGEIRKP